MLLSYGSQLWVPISPFELTVTCTGGRITGIISIKRTEPSRWGYCVDSLSIWCVSHQNVRALDDEGAGLVLWYHSLDQGNAVAHHLTPNQTAVLNQ